MAAHIKEMLQSTGVRKTAEYLRRQGYSVEECFTLIDINSGFRASATQSVPQALEDSDFTVQHQAPGGNWVDNMSCHDFEGADSFMTYLQNTGLTCRIVVKSVRVIKS